MRSHRIAAALTPLALALLLSACGSATAETDCHSASASQVVSSGPLANNPAYWTPERMRDAKPVPMEVDARTTTSPELGACSDAPGAGGRVSGQPPAGARR